MNNSQINSTLIEHCHYKFKDSSLFMFKVSENGRLERKQIHENSPCVCTELIFTSFGVKSIHEKAFHNCLVATELILNKNSLTSISLKELGPLSSKVLSLNLSENKFSKMPSILSHLKLWWLELSFNNITEVIPLCQNWSLVFLSLNSNNIRTIPSNAFPNCKKLFSIRLNNNEISTIHKNTFPLDALDLHVIYLDGNNLKDLPSDIAEMTKLVSLSVDGNRITSLTSASFTKCTSLLELNLGNNRIEHVHNDTFRSLKKLMRLSLSFNLLTAVPNLRSTSYLTWVLLNNNQIRIIGDSSFEKLFRLSWLHLGFNSITQISSLSFRDNGVLQTLYLTKNLLSELPTDINLPNLKYFFINANKISEIEEQQFANMPSLETLSLSNNSIGEIPKKAFIPLKNTAKEIFLYQNLLNEIPEGISYLKSLRKLDISNNKITNIDTNSFQYCENLEMLSINNNEINIFNNSCFAHTPKLSTIVLSYNKIYKITNESLKPIVNVLRHLDLGHNRLKKLPAILTSVKNLVFLSLKYNYLASIKEDMLYFFRQRIVKKNEPERFDSHLYQTVNITKPNTMFLQKKEKLSEIEVVEIATAHEDPLQYSTINLVGNPIHCCSQTADRLF
eukprot:Pgem_evm1s18513